MQGEPGNEANVSCDLPHGRITGFSSQICLVLTIDIDYWILHVVLESYLRPVPNSPPFRLKDSTSVLTEHDRASYTPRVHVIYFL